MAALMERMGPAKSAGAPADEDGDEEYGSADDESDDVEATEPEDEDEDLSDDDGDEGDEDEDTGPDDQGTPAITDETPIEVEIDGEAKTFTVAELKDFAAGREAFVAQAKALDTASSQTAVVLQTAIDIVMQDLLPYKDVDWLKLQNEMPADEFAWHRDNARAAHEKYQKLVGSAEGFEQVLQTRKTEASVEEVTKAQKVLQKDIEGWSDELYGNILDYGVAEGLPQDDVTQITNPVIIKLLNKARLYDAGQKEGAQKMKAAPAKILKPGNRESGAGDVKVRKAQQRIKAGTASETDALQALMARL